MKKLLLFIPVISMLTVATFLQASGPLKINSNGLTTAAVSSDNAVYYKGARIHPGEIVVKVKEVFRSSCSMNAVNVPAFNSAMAKLQSTDVTKKFLGTKQPSGELNKYHKTPVDLSLIYLVKFSPQIDIQKAINVLSSTGLVEYAEPLYLHDFYFTPNDPLIGNQYHITKIKADSAWNVWTGDTNVVIGIVDSGTDWDHPDLAPNIKYNWADPIDGSDNDNDGFVDNFRGWDVSENDNDPMVGVSDHGAGVCGDAAEATDNGIGGAGPAFRCKFLPVKSTHDASGNSIDNGYEGIVYAAEHGVNVINLSWGRSGSPSMFEQDVINNAFYDHDVLVCAAAGNNGADGDYYPASYRHVTSVAATASSDSKAGFSNYGYNIDVCAPGVNIYSTIYNDGYSGTNWSGTSMASPIAAGCAAMVKSRFPFMNAEQVGEQLRITCDNIYSVSGNTPYQYKLGKGRVNMYRAVTDTTSPGVIVDSLIKRDSNDNVFIIGDTMNFRAIFKNLLRPTTNLVCTLTCISTYVQILGSNIFTAGAINTMDTISNYSSPYRVLINSSAPTNASIVFRITMTDGAWSDFYVFRVTVNVDYINIDINDVAASITSKSLIGYNDSAQIQGIGFTYMGGATLLYEMGLVVGASGTQVSDNVRADGAIYDHDFAPFVTVSGQNPGTVSDFDAYGSFRDNGITSSAPMNLLVNHHAYAWVSVPDRKYIMVQYYIHNNGSNTLTDMYAGIFADWDIPLYSNNKCSMDNTRRMGYVWSTDAGGMWAGIKVLSHTGGFSHQAMDNVPGGGGGLDVSTNGFTNALKYTALSTLRADGGNTAVTGNDVLDLVSTGPITLAVNDSVEVAFALIAGEDLASLQSSADAAQAKYDDTFVGIQNLISSAHSFSLSACYPNPASGNTSIEFNLKETNKTELSIYNSLGEKVKTVLSEKLSSGKYSVVADLSSLPQGIYFYKLVSGTDEKTMPLTILR